MFPVLTLSLILLLQTAASEKLTFRPGTVITFATENGDLRGTDYAFLVSIRRLDAKGFEFGWSIAAPLNVSGSREIARTDLDESILLDNWYYAGESGLKPNVVSNVFSRSLFDRLMKGETVTAGDVLKGPRSFRKTQDDTFSVIVDGKPRPLRIMVLHDDGNRVQRVLVDRDFPLWLSWDDGEARARVVSIQTSVEGDRAQLENTGRLVSYGIHFNTNSADILPESGPALGAVLAFLRKNPAAHLRIEGHTDGTGSDAHNLDLSRNRALSVKGYLVKNKIAASRLATDGRGESQPLGDNSTSTGRAQNRRVVFEVVKP